MASDTQAQWPLHIVFDGPPSHESGRFVEVNDHTGKSVRAGEWIESGQFWELVIQSPAPPQPTGEDAELVAEAIDRTALQRAGQAANDASDVSARIQAGGYRANLSDVERLRNDCRGLADIVGKLVTGRRNLATRLAAVSAELEGAKRVLREVDDAFVQVPRSYVKGVRDLHDIIAKAYVTDDRPDTIRLQTGRVLDGEDGGCLTRIFAAMRDGLSDLIVLSGVPLPDFAALASDHQPSKDETR